MGIFRILFWGLMLSNMFGAGDADCTYDYYDSDIYDDFDDCDDFDF